METKENMERHAQLCGIFWIVYGILSLLGGIIVAAALLVLAHLPEIRWECSDLGPNLGPQLLQIIGLSIGSLLIVLGVFKIIGGAGLQKRREWARIMILVLAFLSLVNIPLGTALGIYSIAYLMKPEMLELFKPKAA